MTANCTAFHGVYPHGVRRAGAVDLLSGAPNPKGTAALISTPLYQAAIAANPDLDRDGDGVACEKR